MEVARPLFSSFPGPDGSGLDLAPGHWAWRHNRLPWCHGANPSTTLNETVASTDADTLMTDGWNVNGFLDPFLVMASRILDPLLPPNKNLIHPQQHSQIKDSSRHISWILVHPAGWN
jgi:hypothetical protein